MASETLISIAQKVHLAQIKLAPSYFPILSGSGPSRFRAQMQQPETLSDSINFVSFRRLFCHDLDLAILLHQDVSGDPSLLLFGDSRLDGQVPSESAHQSLPFDKIIPFWR